MYVWFDALTNYISGVNYPNGPLSEYWPVDVHLIGKDIYWFHTVIWPCMLMSVGIPLPKQVVCHGFVNAEDGRKMSKSYGNAVDPNDVLVKYDSDLVRYFCLREGVFGEDLSYSEKSLITRHDSELADVIGNLVRRTFKLAIKWNEGKVPNETYDELFSVEELKHQVDELMSKFQIHRAFESVLNCMKITNKYLADIAPWKLTEDNQMPIKLKCVRTALEALYILGHFYLPIIPNSMVTLFNNFDLKPITLVELKGWGNLKSGHVLNFDHKLLFPRIGENSFQKKIKQQQIDNVKPTQKIKQPDIKDRQSQQPSQEKKENQPQLDKKQSEKQQKNHQTNKE